LSHAAIDVWPKRRWKPILHVSYLILCLPFYKNESLAPVHDVRTPPLTHIPKVGHERSALTQDRTLDTLYLTPILDTLSRQNPQTDFIDAPTRNGVYDADSDQTLYLFIDLKTPGPETWTAVLSALEPLQKGGWLSTYDGETFTERPVTVVGTGNTPVWAVQAAVPRHAFYDAPLALLDSDFANVTANDAPIASTNFAASFGEVRGRGLSEEQLGKLREQVKVAHERGIKVRYWNQPNWPVGTRNAVWRTLWEEGVDLLNADDLEGVSGFWETG
jgi:hypothetical protein